MRSKLLENVLLSSALVLASTASPILADVVEIGASKDNTLFEESGSLSNGAGEYLFAGFTALDQRRRGLIAFDIAGSVPAGSTIDNVALTLTMSRTIVGSEPISLHRLESDWGEAGSDAPGQEGTGTAAEPGDATWTHTFFPGDFWGTAGGDFLALPSATQDVDGDGPYTWSSALMVDDVQSWLDGGAGSFGWIILGGEGVSVTAKRFNSRQNADSGTHPVLSIEFTPPASDDGGVPATSGAGLVVMVVLLLILGSAAAQRYGSARTR